MTRQCDTERELFVEVELIPEVPGIIDIDIDNTDDYLGMYELTSRGHLFKLDPCRVAAGSAHTRRLPIEPDSSERTIEVTVKPEVELSSFTIPLLDLSIPMIFDRVSLKPMVSDYTIGQNSD